MIHREALLGRLSSNKNVESGGEVVSAGSLVSMGQAVASTHDKTCLLRLGGGSLGSSLGISLGVSRPAPNAPIDPKCNAPDLRDIVSSVELLFRMTLGGQERKAEINFLIPVCEREVPNAIAEPV
jgi:hypothetical protein